MQPDQLGTVRELMSRVEGLSGSNSLIIANKIDDDVPENGIRQTLQYYFPSIPRICLVKLFRGSEPGTFPPYTEALLLRSPQHFESARRKSSSHVISRLANERRPKVT